MTFILQDTTNNHNSGFILVFCNWPNPGLIVKAKESYRCIIAQLLPKLVKLTLCLSQLTMYWFINEFSRWILDIFNVKSLSNSIPFLCGFYLSFSATVTITGCFWTRFSMLCHKHTFDMLFYKSICYDSTYSACFRHNYHHSNIISISNWFWGS